MKLIIILLSAFGASMGSVVPISPGELSNLVAARQGYPLNLQSQSLQISAYDIDETYPQYLVYDVPQVTTGVRTIATAVFANGRPTIAHIPTTYNYYGTPVYDFRYPYNPNVVQVLPGRPGVKPMAPGHFPRPELPRPPAKTPSNDDGIETLDEKVQPESINRKPVGSIENEEDDSVAIEAA